MLSNFLLTPAGATRLFLGIPDDFGFGDAPGAYDDNDGSYRVRLGINEILNSCAGACKFLAYGHWIDRYSH